MVTLKGPLTAEPLPRSQRVPPPKVVSPARVMFNTWPYSSKTLLTMAPAPPTPVPETVTGVLLFIVLPLKSSVELLVMVMEAALAKAKLPATTVPPLMATGPVKLLTGTLRVSLLAPFLVRPPTPVSVPEPLIRKLLVPASTVMTLGETVPLTETVVGTPTVSSNNTWSLALNTVCTLLLKLIQLAELPSSHTPVLPPAFHCKLAGVGRTNRNSLDCLAFRLTLNEPVTVEVVPSHKLVMKYVPGGKPARLKSMVRLAD